MSQQIIDISTPDDGLGDVLRTGFDKTNQNFTELYNGKVDKVTGKGLSENDFTDSDKAKLDGIEAGAQVNVQADAAETDPLSPSYIQNLPPSLYSAVGHFHYADLATQTTPLSVVANVAKKLTNDTLGANTELDFAPYAVPTVWDDIQNSFNFSNLDLGDSASLRLDLAITTTSANQTIQLYLKFGVGTASEYDLLIDSWNEKSTVTFKHFLKTIDFSIDNQDWKSAPAELFILSDANASVKVNGFYVPIIRKSVNIVNFQDSPIYKQKNESAAYNDPTLSGSDAVIPLQPNGQGVYSFSNAGLTSIDGFGLNLITGNPSAEVPYPGKDILIYNNKAENLTLKHDGSGTADVKFLLEGGVDLVVPAGGKVWLKYGPSYCELIFKSWSTLDEATDFGNTTTNNITTGIITTPMVEMPEGSFNVQIYPVELTANRKLQAPDKNGIIATLDDIPLNPITGTGTINKLPKFTGSGTLGNSQIFDNGTNVGIGTTSPFRTLDVNGTLRLQSPTIDLGNSTDNQIWVSSNNINFKTNGSEKAIITSGGNVGIGTTSPSERLEVQNGASGAKIKVSNSGGGYAMLECSSNATSVAQLSFTNQLSLIGGNVGIGTSSPSAKLNVSGDIHIGDYGSASSRALDFRTSNSVFTITTDGTSGGLGTTFTYSWVNGGQGPLKFNNAAGEVMRLSSTGNVGIGTTAPSYPLYVAAQVSNISIYADYDIVAYSDQSVKENIRPIENALERVIKSRGVLYDRTDSGEKNNIGFIAQELEVAFPELVVTNEDGTKAVKYQNAVAVLFEAIKEQQKQIEELKQIVNGFTN